MKILHAISQRPSSTGSGIYVQAMLRESARRGHENYLLAGVPCDWSTYPEGVTERQCSFVTFDGGDLPFPTAGMSDIMPYPSKRFCDFTPEELSGYHAAFQAKLNRIISDFKPDVIHSHHLWLMSSLIRRLFPHIRMVTSSHGSDLRQFRNCPQFRSTVLEGCRTIEVILALTEDQKKNIAKLYGIRKDKILVAGAGFNEELFYKTKKSGYPPVEILYVGKLSRAKGIPWLLKALEQIDEPDWRIRLVGSSSGKDQQQTEGLIRKLGHKANALGALPQEKTAEAMRRSNILVLPSFYEGLPLVLLEALACGCRIVATELPGIKELFRNRKSDVISLVPLPRLKNVDVPLKKDEAGFTMHLKQALEKQINAAVTKPNWDNPRIKAILENYTWQAVFSRVEAAFMGPHPPAPSP